MIVPQSSPQKQAYSVTAFEERKERKGHGKKRCSSLVPLLLPKLFHLVTCLWEHFASLFGLMDCIPDTLTVLRKFMAHPYPHLYISTHRLDSVFFFFNIDLI